MSNSLDENAGRSDEEQVIREPIDEFGLILKETRIAKDGTTTTRNVTLSGRPVRSMEESAQMDCPLPPEAPAAVDPDNPLGLVSFTKIDADGKMRNYVRTRSGREFPETRADDKEWFEKMCPYDPDL